MSASDKAYLGDGCYVAFDGYHFVLTTENGIRVTNVIYLEPEVLAKFDGYRRRLNEEQMKYLKGEK